MKSILVAAYDVRNEDGTKYVMVQGDSASIVSEQDAIKYVEEYGQALSDLPMVEMFARRCDISDRLMNEGYVWGDGTYYSETKEDTIVELRTDIISGAYDFDEVGKDVLLAKSDNELLDYAYNEDIFHYTEWIPSEESEFTIVVNGIEYEIEND